LAALALPAVILAATSGCTAAVSVGVSLVGKAVDSADVNEHKKVVLGKEPAVADERFGERLDVLRDVNGDRAWLIYPAQNDPLGKDHYVVEVANEKIVAFTRAEKNSDPKRDIPRALIIANKVKGKAPPECETKLEMGKPLLTVRSDFTGLLSQVYDARHFKDLGSPDYCILRYDEQELCKEVEFLGIGASTKKEPLSNKAAET
jgi:hypothetical protein